MTDSSQKKKALTFIDAIVKQDRARMRAVCHADFTFKSLPPSLGGRTFSGDAAIDMLSSAAGTVYQSGTMAAAVSRAVEDAVSVVLELNIRGTTLKGRPYDNCYVMWFDFRDGLIAGLSEHVDTKYAFEVVMS